MLRIENLNENEIVLHVELPSGKTQNELMRMLENELENLKENFYGKIVKINGRVTTGMSLILGHFLSHVSKEIWIFDPKENTYFLAIRH